MQKTNVIRILEKENIPRSVYPYDIDEDDLSGKTVAKKISADPDSVFKTLAATGNKNGINVFCIPVTSELNLKKAAAESGNKKIEMIKMKDLFSLTGYIRGGCSPIGMKKNYPVFIDGTAEIFNKIFISAGVRGIQISLPPHDLLKIVNGKSADLI